MYRGIESWVQGIEKFGNGGRERALDGLVEAFLQVRGLVPTAKKSVAHCFDGSTLLILGI